MMPAIDLAGLGARASWLMVGEWRAHPARLLVAVLAIAVGVALGFAVHLVNSAALASFARAVGHVSGAADVQVRAISPQGVDEALYPKLARIEGVAAVSPVVELSARLPAYDDRPGARIMLIGLDPMRAMAVTPGLVGAPLGGPGQDLMAGASVYLSRAAMQAAGVKPGAPLVLTAAGRAVPLRVAGVLPAAGEEAVLAVMDVADAQWRFGQLGRLHRLDIGLADGADRAAVLARIEAVLPETAEIMRAEDEASRSASLSRAYRVNLGMLAMVALLTGGFLVFSAQSLSVARRIPQFALLRVIGMGRGALRGQLLLEGALLGVAGAALGVAGGHGLAAAVLALVGGDLGGGYFGRAAPSLAFDGPAALGFAALGVAVALVASWWPAEAAARAQPAVALKAGGEAGDAARRWPAMPGLLLLAAGGLCALAPPLPWLLGGLPLLGYAAMALLLAGGVAIMPWAARAMVRPALARDWPVPMMLALRRLHGAPSAAAVALAGIVASTSLMVAMAVMVASFRGSVDEWLGQLLPSDVYLHLEGADAGGLAPDVQARLAALPGVESVRFVRQMPLKLAPDRPAIVLSGQPMRPDPGAQLPMIGGSRAVAPGAVPVWVSEPFAWLEGVKPGDRLRLPGLGEVQVAGVWRDYARQFGAIAMDDADFERLTGDRSKTEAAFTLVPGQQAAPVMKAIRAAVPASLRGQLIIAEPRVLRVQALAIFDQSFLVTYALEVVAILIGLAGVATAFSAQTLARAREFGMMRHLGVQRRQIAAQLALEGAALGLVGALAGVALGLVMSQVLIHVINPQSFHWTMNTQLPWGLLAGLVAALVSAAAGTALLAGRRALAQGAVQAVRADW